MFSLSHQGHLHKLCGFQLELAVVIAAGLGFTLFGYDQGVMSGIITEPLFVKQFPKMSTDYKTASIQALVVAIYEIGALMGAIVIYFVGDKLGRRRSIFIGSLIMIVGAIAQTAAYELRTLIAGRIVTGMGNGMNTSTIPVWQSEMAAPSRRGFLVLFEGALIACGIAIVRNLGFWFLSAEQGAYDTSAQWRTPLALQIVFAVAMVAGVWLLPESPRWLMKHGQDDEARHVLGRLRANGNSDDSIVHNELAGMKQIIEETDRGGKLTVKELFSNGPSQNLRRLLLAVGAQAMQQLGGINLVTYYATSVFENSIGTSPTVSRILTVANGWEYFASAVLALFVVDRLGRRKLMVIGAAVMAISTMFLAGFLSTGKKNFAIGAAVFTFVFNSGFAFGWLGVTWLYPAEITPLRIRQEANALATCSNWLGNYLIVQIAPIGLNSIDWKFYLVFMCTNLVFIPIVILFYPETAGWSLEQMDLLFEESHAVKRNPVFVEREFRFLQREDKTEELESRLHNKIGASEKRRENVDTDAEHSDGRTQ